MIATISIRGFRGVPRELKLDLARITLFSGRNGLGKTTVFDAVDWCLFGSAWRLGDDHDSLRNLYDPQAEPHIAISLVNEGIRTIIERGPGGASLDGHAISDRDLIYRFIRDPDMLPPYARDIAQRLRRLVYLPQAEIRELLSPAASTQREALLQSLLGVPDAAVVDASLRRLEDRLSVRRRGLEGRLAQIQSDIQQVVLDADTFAQHGAPDRQALLSQAKTVLGVDAASVDSLDGLLTVCRDAIEAVKRRRNALDDLKAFLADQAGRRGGLIVEIQSRQSEIDLLAERVFVIEQELRTASEQCAAEEADLRQALQTVEAATKALNSARDRLVWADAEAQTRQALQEQSRLHADAEAAAARARLDAQTASAATAAAAAAHASILSALDRAQARAEAVHRLAAIAAKRNELETNRQEIQKSLENATATLKRLNSDLAAARNRHDIASTFYANYLPTASLGDRLGALLIELARLVADLGLSACPLCGCEYGDSADLAKHLTDARGRHEREAMRMAELRRALDEAENAKTLTEQQLRDTASSVGALQGKLVALTVDLQRLEAEHKALSDQTMETPDTEIATLGHELRICERNLSLTRQKQAEAERALSEAEDTLRTRAEQFAAVQSRLDELLRQRPDEQIAIGSARADLLTSEQGYHDSVTRKQRLEEDLKSARMARTNVTEKLIQDQQQLAELRGRVSAAMERVGAIDNEIQTRKARLSPAGRDITQDTAQELNQVAHRESELRELEAGLDAAMASERQQETTFRLKMLGESETAIIQEIQELARAAGRLDGIALAVRQRARDEASTALGRQEAAIQECLAALYPHEHLDRIHLDPSTSDLLLTDRLLSQGVNPHYYTSTGQLNALALAVFVGIALRQSVCTLQLLMLDEPIQNLDDLHFLAFITLIKRVALTRQVVLSTADNNVAQIFERQMKSTWPSESGLYAHYEWSEFDPTLGPRVERVLGAPMLRHVAGGRGSAA